MKDRATERRQPEEVFITNKEAAELLKVSLPTLRKYVQIGMIPHYRIGRQLRFKKSEVIDAITITPVSAFNMEEMDV